MNQLKSIYIMTTLFCILCIIGGAVVFAIDWQNVKPLHIFKELPFQRSSMNNPEGRITNGQVANRSQFPHQTALFIDVAGGRASCGGTLVFDKCVVTAAHCVYQLTNKILVYLGAWNISDSKEVGQRRLVVNQSSVTVHPQWDPQRILNDIAVIRLNESVTDNKYIKPAKLPTGSSSYTGKQAIASGYGKISDSATSITDVLRWVQQPVIPNWKCNLKYYGMIKESHICTSGDNGRSTCNGDSGGPLVLAQDHTTLIGVVSFGSSSGCETEWPPAFTRVTSFLNFIQSNCNK